MFQRRFAAPHLLILFLAAGLLLVACAINPATGKRQLVLVSEAQEIQLGLENDKVISAQMGLYDDEGLQAYIQELGGRMAALSERPQLEWTFRVVDDPVVNAFALPGGYIYITRGILAHINNEAELAGVVGHEIGHVTARHGVSQMSKAQLAQLGLGVGTILAPRVAQNVGDLAQTGLSLLFLKYGRDDERQADELGLRYMLAAGYPPGPMVDVFDMLGRVSASHDGERLPGWMSTHPAPENREALTNARIGALGQDLSGRSERTEPYQRQIDGITFGEDPRAGFFRDELFLHPEMAFQFRFPAGWKMQNQRQAVVAMSPDEDAAMQLTMAQADSAAAALQKFLSPDEITRLGPAMGSINGMRTAGDSFSVMQPPRLALRGRVGFVEYAGTVFQLVGYCPEESWAGYESTIRRSLASFNRLTERKALDAKPRRLDVVRVDRAMSLDEFARRYDATVTPTTLALINRLDEGGRLQAGRSYKVVTGGPEGP